MQADQEKPSSAQPVPAKRRRWPLIAALVVVALAAGAVIAWRELGGKLKSTEPYQMALAKVQAAPEVIAQLGQPIRDVEILPSGSLYGDKANLMFRIAGPKGRGSVRAEARRIGGAWGLSLLEVTTADQKRISVNTASGSGGEGDAPAWKPGAPAKPDSDTAKTPPLASPGPDIQLEVPDLAAPGK